MSNFEDKVSHILCVDPNEMTLKLLGSVLGKEGYIVSTQECGKKSKTHSNNIKVSILSSSLQISA